MSGERVYRVEWRYPHWGADHWTGRNYLKEAAAHWLAERMTGRGAEVRVRAAELGEWTWLHGGGDQ